MCFLLVTKLVEAFAWGVVAGVVATLVGGFYIYWRAK